MAGAIIIDQEFDLSFKKNITGYLNKNVHQEHVYLGGHQNPPSLPEWSQR